MWTPSKDAELKRLWKTHSASEIGSMLGVTRNAVIGRYHRLCGTYDARTLELRQSARSDAAKRRAKAKVLEDGKILELKRLITGGVARDQAVVRARKDGLTLRAIGVALGLTRQRIQQIEIEQKIESR